VRRIDDWCLVAARPRLGDRGYTNSPLWSAGYSALYIAVMFAWYAAARALPGADLPEAGGSRLTCSPSCWWGSSCRWVTDHIGIHFIFGAFVFGVIIPREAPALFQEILERLEQISVLLLLPIFFIVTGLSVDLSKLTGNSVGELFAVLGVAIGGKFIAPTSPDERKDSHPSFRCAGVAHEHRGSPSWSCCR